MKTFKIVFYYGGTYSGAPEGRRECEIEALDRSKAEVKFNQQFNSEFIESITEVEFSINMKTKHTPAPWTVANGNSVNKNGRLICIANSTKDVSTSTSLERSNESKANARLIASAPELLEALKDVAASRSLMMKQAPSEIEIKEILATFERVDQVIAKAEDKN